jgi:hypothetical protein
MDNSSAALIDAAIVYGANRWLRGYHNDQSYEFRGQHNLDYDRRLFSEFLHLLLLFDQLVLDSSSVERIGQEIREMFAHVNAKAGSSNLLSYREVATTKTLSPVMLATCELIADILKSGKQSPEALQSIPVPWAYRDQGHVDHKEFAERAAQANLDPALIPLGIFAFRGLAYAGYAHAQANMNGDISTYVAAPGRISALKPFLDGPIVAELEYPRKAYGALVETLGLPSKGYDFSFLGIFAPAQVSTLAREIEQLPAREALRWMLRRRREGDAEDIRRKWQKQLWAKKLSKIVGTDIHQVATGNHVGGDLIQLTVGTSI